MGMQFIDTHAHIYSVEFEEDIDEVLLKADESEVMKVIMPNINSQSIESMLGIEQRNPKKYFSTMGLHPCYVKEDYKDELKIIESWLVKRDFIAIGEIGIDLYWDRTFFEQQKSAFEFQCELAKDLNLPIIIHARDSLNEIFEVMDKVADESLTGVFHCFSGDLEQAKRAQDFGFYLGFGGVATFKNGGLDSVLPFVDQKRIVLETDAPYLSPVPYRGKRNEPSYVPIIAKRIAELLEIGIEHVAHQTTLNAEKLFNLS